MIWNVLLIPEVVDWICGLDDESANLVRAALAVLGEDGPHLGRPLVDSIKGSQLNNMKELRPGSSGRSELRLLFAFDPFRQAVILVGGDKRGEWSSWYRKAIPLAESRFLEHLKEQS